MISKRFIVTILTLLVIGIGAGIAVFLAKGYRISPDNGTISGTGILSVTSIPDQASVYVDGHLTTATNANINSLTPKQYDVRIVKEGFIPWEKKVEVREGLVTDVKATLFRAIPTVYPFTYTGVENVTLSPDEQKLVYVIPDQGNDTGLQARKAGIWIWQMSDRPVAFGRGNEPTQIALPINGLDYNAAKLSFSPDSSQVLVSFPDRYLLLDINRLNDPPRDVTPQIQGILREWQQDTQANNLTKLQLIIDPTLRKTASGSAVLKWSADESKILYSVDGKTNYKVADLITSQQYDLPQAATYAWLPDSEHLVLVENINPATPTPVAKSVSQASPSATPAGQNSNNQQAAKISIIEYDAGNKSEIFAGNFDPNAVFVWPDGSRIIIVSSLPTATASKPNLYGINLQ